MSALYPPRDRRASASRSPRPYHPGIPARGDLAFWARAEGRGGLESDWDLLVVVPDDTPAERLTVVAGYEAIRGTGVPADVVPTRRRRFEALKQQVGSLSYVAWRRGQLVYGA